MSFYGLNAIWETAPAFGLRGLIAPSFDFPGKFVVSCFNGLGGVQGGLLSLPGTVLPNTYHLQLLPGLGPPNFPYGYAVPPD